MRRWTTVLLAATALGLLAGCGGDDEEDSAGEATPTTTQAEQSTATQEVEARGEAVEVVAKDIRFDPHDATVGAGQTVRWTNEDEVDHTVTKTAGPGAKFDEPLAPGGTVEVTFEEAGKIDYVCTIHPGQDGTVTVE